MPYVRKRRTTVTRRKRTTRRSRPSKGLSSRRSYRRTTRRTGKALKLRSKWENPVAHSKLVKFKYCDDGFTVSCLASNSYQATYVFRGNSCFDPDYTGIGVQPYGWDQYDGLYDFSTVYASKIQVTFSSPDAYQDLKVYIVPACVPAFTYHDPSDLKMTPRVRWKEGAWFARQRRANTLSNYSSTRSMRPNLGGTEKDYEQGFSNGPALTWYWIIYFDAGHGGLDTVIDFDVKITYYTICRRDNNINES